MRGKLQSVMSVSLQERGDEMHGSIRIIGDNIFALEAIAEIIKSLSEKSGVPVDEVIQDVYRVATGLVAKEVQ